MMKGDHQFIFAGESSSAVVFNIQYFLPMIFTKIQVRILIKFANRNQGSNNNLDDKDTMQMRLRT